MRRARETPNCEIGTYAVPAHRAKFVKQGSRVATDEAKTFRNLGEYGYQHGTVNHKDKQYVSGQVHTNNMEAFWGHVKRSLKGNYVNVSEKWLQTYLWEFEYRQNLRKSPHLMLEALLISFPRPEAALSASRGEDGQSVA